MGEKHITRKKRREGGQALAEFALLAPLLAILIFGIVDTARAYQAWVTVQGAAREGARYGVTGQSTCTAANTRLECIEQTTRTQAKSLTNSSTTLDVSVRSWAYPDYNGSPSEGDPGDQCDALEVEVVYDFEPATPIIGGLLGGVTMVGRERMVNEPFGVCG